MQNWHVSPIKHSNFKNVAPAVVYTAEMDPLRGEGEAYAKKLIEGGCQVETHLFKGAPHTYAHLDEILESGKLYNRMTVDALNRAFGAAG